MRTVLALTLLVLAVSSGCSGLADETATPTTDATTSTANATIPTTDATTTVETATDATAGGRTTATTDPTTTTKDRPQKGDQLLSVSELNESQAMAWNASKRAAFGNLSAERQRVVEAAVECDCNVELDGEFSFHDKDRVEVVYHEGSYYFLRVSIV